jgi:hypothetical protein
MAEIVGLLASTASLISLAHETCKLCNNLRKDIACFRNAPAEVSRLSSELLDLAQLLDLISCVLQPLHDRKAVDEVLAYAESSAFLGIRFCVYPTSLLYGEFENSTPPFPNCPKLKLFRSLCLLMFLTFL